MPRVKRRAKRPKEPTVFSVRFTRRNLARLKEIHAELDLDNRNMTINHIIENYHKYQVMQDFIESLRKIFRAELNARVKET